MCIGYKAGSTSELTRFSLSTHSAEGWHIVSRSEKRREEEKQQPNHREALLRIHTVFRHKEVAIGNIWLNDFIKGLELDLASIEP